MLKPKKQPSWGKEIKCPRCGGAGKSILEDGRLMFRCFGACQLETLLKLIQ